jgi:hypothetical protein
MASCAHQQWLRLSEDENGFVLQYGTRLYNITDALPHPARQYPSLISFIGKRSKARALRSLFPGSGISGSRRFGIANICVDQTSANSDHPILVAESSPEYTPSNPRVKEACHETTTHHVSWPDNGNGSPTQQDLVYHVHARLLSLFTDVVCIFADDSGGIDKVAEQLAVWTAIGSASSLPSSVRPRLLVVTSISGIDFHSEALRFRLRVLSDSTFLTTFSSLNVVNVLGLGRARRENFSGLGQVLSEEIRTARVERVNTHTMFSMVHLTALFDMALKNFAASPRRTFDFIRYSREDNPVPPNFQRHLTSFTTLCAEQSLPDSILWDFIASAIVLDCFPPDMHCKSQADPAPTC